MTRSPRTRLAGGLIGPITLALVAGACSAHVDQDRLTIEPVVADDQPAPDDLALVDALADPPPWADVAIFEAAGVRSYRERLRIEGPGFALDQRSDATVTPWAVSQLTTVIDRGRAPAETRVVATADGAWARFDGTRDWYEEPFFAYEAGLGLGRLADGDHVVATLDLVGDAELDGKVVARYRGDPGGDYIGAGISDQATAAFDYWVDGDGLVLRIEGTIADGADRYLYQYDLFELGADIRIDAPDPASVVVFD